MGKEIKIKTPYGDKNWAYVKRLFDEDANGLINELAHSLESIWVDFPELLRDEDVNGGDLVQYISERVKRWQRLVKKAYK